MFIFRIPYLIQSLFWKRQWRGKEPTSVYLTFDDGPEEKATPWLLDLLHKEKIQATFFCVGNQIERYPSLFKKITEHGHVVGNHTYNHEKGNKTQNAEYLSSIEKTDALMHSNLFRPPYGRLTRKQQNKIISLGKRIVMWTWISHDYDQRIQSKKIIKKANLIKGGDIILFHNNTKSMKNLTGSLPEVIQIIRSKGLTFKPISI